MMDFKGNTSSSSLDVHITTPKIIVKKKLPPKRSRKNALVKAPHVVRKILHKVNVKNSNVLYYTQGKSVNEFNAIDVTKLENRFINTIDSEEELAITRFQGIVQPAINKEYRDKKFNEKSTESSRRNLDLPKRVWIKEPEELPMPISILEIDPEFHQFVLGRPTALKRFNLSQYLDNQREALRTRISASIYDDESDIIRRTVLVKQAHIADEMKEAHIHTKWYYRYMNTEFAIGMQWVGAADESTLFVKMVDVVCNEIHRINERDSDETLNAEWRWRTLRLYQKFLYFVSPLPWRMRYDYIHRKELWSGREPRLSTIFKKYVLTEQGYIPPLEVLVDEYLRNLEFEEEPLLYFTKPSEIFEVIRALEAQSLNCYRQAASYSFALERIGEAIVAYKEETALIRADLQYDVNHIKRAIHWKEIGYDHLIERWRKMMYRVYVRRKVNKKLLKMYARIEIVFEACIEKNVRILPMTEMLTRIEHYYHTLLVKLETFPLEIVVEAETLGFEEYLESVRALKWVIKELKKLSIVYKKVRRIADPPYHKKRDLVWRSYPGKEPPIIPYIPRVLTEDEIVYLRGFTLWIDTQKVEDHGIDLSVDESDIQTLIYTIKPGKN